MLKKLNNKAWFEEIFILILTIISVVFWKFNSDIGLILLIVIALFSLILFNDFKYIVPCVVFYIFTNNKGFSNSKIPIFYIISTVSLIIVMVLFFIKNKPNFKNIKSYKGLILLSISCFIPILWNNIIPKDNKIFYLIYFAYLLYLLIYLLFSVSTNKNSFRILILTMCYLGILISLQCEIKVLELYIQEPRDNIFSYWYYLGWGLCNEAGIMMCMCIPFIFITIIKSNNIINMCIRLLMLIVVYTGMLFTGSRGTILFGSIELILLFAWTTIRIKNKIQFISIFFGYILFIATLLFAFGVMIDFINDIRLVVNNLNDSGRFKLWLDGINLWEQDFLSILFGRGQVAEIKACNSAYGVQDGFIVYHSTFFHCLTTMGIIGLIFMVIHFIEKYKQIFRYNTDITGLLLIGYVIVDLYGLIDNTYGMYYYMIVLMIIMAIFDEAEPHTR